MAWGDDANLPPTHALRAAVICFLLALAALLVAVSSGHCEESDTALKVATVAVVGVAAVDAAQTVTCTRAGTCRELNPLLQPVAGSVAGLAAMKVGVNGALVVAAWKLHAHHPRLAWLLVGSALGVQTCAVAWNWRQLAATRSR